NGKAPYMTIGMMKKQFPNPYSDKSDKIILDPQYPIQISQTLLTDHFYDTGIYQVEWKFSRFWKTNHPFMGKMSFPENEDKPSRTITATRIANSRESIIYRSEVKRIGDGEYRLPTVREAAIIMGFPITYQFVGSENSKWRLVGNAVCASVSRAFAETVLNAYKVRSEAKLVLQFHPKLEGVQNLNTYTLKCFDSPPTKNRNARCRLQAIKDGNLTVTLSNYKIGSDLKEDRKWRTSIQYGTGKGFPIQHVEDGYYRNLESLIQKVNGGVEFLEIINNGFSEKIGNASQLQ